MTTIAGLIGSGAGVVVIALALLLTRHLGFVPGFLRGWVERAIIVLMYAGGSAIAVTTLGSWSTWLIQHIADLLGGLNAGIPHTALTVVAMVLIFAVGVSLVVAPNAATGVVAAMLPLILGLVAGGVIHQVYLQTVIPGQALAAQISSWIGG